MENANPPQSPSSLPTDQPIISNPSPNQSKKLLFTFAIIFAFIIVGSGAYYLGMQNGKTTSDNPNANVQPTSNPQNNIVSNPTNTPVTTQNPQANETANWKMYTNNVFGLSFKYPTNFTVNDKLPTTKTAQFSASNNLVLEDAARGMTLSIWVNPDGFGPFFVDKVYDEVAYIEDKGIYVIKETTIPDNKNGAPGKTSIMTRQDLQIQGHNLFMVFSYNENDANGEKVFKDILSTFKLVK